MAPHVTVRSPASLVGVVLLIVGVLGVVLFPVMAMFSEGIPRDIPGGPGLSLGIELAVSVSSIIAGFGIYRGREWGRVLGMAILVAFVVLLAPSVWLLVPIALQFVLLRRWRTS
jgi:hypothetical protein